jgi:hypothetical protein
VSLDGKPLPSDLQNAEVESHSHFDERPVVATLEIEELHFEGKSLSSGSMPDHLECRLTVRDKEGKSHCLKGFGSSDSEAIAVAVSGLCRVPLAVGLAESFVRDDGRFRCRVVVEREQKGTKSVGVGRAVASSERMAFCIAILRGVHHAGWLKLEFAANNQKALRGAAHELTRELVDTLGLGSVSELKRAEAEGCILESFNRIASAAVITATNVPDSSSVLRLFDTSAWLYDAQGRRRDNFIDTDSWLAWYPGLDNESMTIEQVLLTLPKVPASEIPWLIRLFENPESPFRFRGAIHLAEHDILHVLLGRGLQDQDEAFVLGFAMGTAKKVSRFQYHVFRWFMVHVYPEPYRIPKFVLPAFDIGVRCGKETGNKNLYRESLQELKPLTISEARKRCGIDPAVLRRAFREEQTAIPFTIAGLRLPTNQSSID